MKVNHTNYFSINQNSTKQSFWNQLQTDIQQIGQRARTNLQKYEENKFNEALQKQEQKQMVHKKLFVGKISPIRKAKHLNQSLNSIDLSQARRMQNQQKLKQKILKNRIKFLKVEEHKQYKTIELARKKYQKIINVRNSSLKEKQMIKKKRQSMLIDQLKEKQEKVKKVKKQYEERLLSQSKLREQNKYMGQKERRLKKLHSVSINHQKSLDLVQKKDKVRQTKSSLSISRQRMTQLNQSRIQQNKHHHQIKILQKFRSIQTKNKINNRLSNHLQRQIDLMKQKKRRSTLELQSFQKSLGVNIIKKTQNTINLDRKNRSRKGNSFYLTSY